MCVRKPVVGRQLLTKRETGGPKCWHMVALVPAGVRTAPLHDVVLHPPFYGNSGIKGESCCCLRFQRGRNSLSCVAWRALRSDLKTLSGHGHRHDTKGGAMMGAPGNNFAWVSTTREFCVVAFEREERISPRGQIRQRSWVTRGPPCQIRKPRRKRSACAPHSSRLGEGLGTFQGLCGMPVVSPKGG